MNLSKLQPKMTGMLTVAALCGGSVFQSAHAGYWTTAYEFVAQTEASGYTPTTRSGTTVAERQSSASSFTGQGTSSITMPAGVVAKAKVVYKVTPILKWYAYGPGDLPPVGKVTIAQQSTNSTQAQIPFTTYDGVQGTVSTNPIFENPLGGEVWKNGYEMGKTSPIQLLQRDNSLRSTEIRLDELSFTTSNEATPQQATTRTWVGVSAGYKAWIDPRSVTISRVGAPTAKQESSPGPTVNNVATPGKTVDGKAIDPAKDEWIGIDGIGHGHTTYSYNYFDIYVDVPVRRSYYNWQSFTATPVGWAPTSRGSWSPNDIDDTGTQHKQDIDFGTMDSSLLGRWVGKPTGTAEKIVTYTITDNSNTPSVTARRQYKLTLHDTFEKLTHNKAPNTPVNVRPHPQGGMARCTRPNEQVAVTCTNSFDWQISATIAGEPAKFLAESLGVEIGGSIGASVGAEASYTVSDIPVGYGTYLEIYDLLDVHTGTANEWSKSGWVGEKPFTFSVPSSPKAYGSQIHTPYVQMNPLIGGTPTPGGNG